MQRNSRFPKLSLFALAAGLAGCAPSGLERPTDSVTVRAPASWKAAGEGADGTISEGWLSDFNDPKLDQLVAIAIARNGDLAAAAARMREAELLRIVGRSRLLPRVDADSSGSLSNFENGPLASTQTERYGLSVSTAWEVDLWGRLRDLTRADAADAEVARANFRGARLSLAAATARAWCNLIEAEQQLTLARVILDSFERNLRISERNYQGTGQGALDVQFGRTNVASARRGLEARTLERDEAARTLEVLTGRYPDASSVANQDLPKLRGSVPAGLPANLIERRPDLVAGRARIYASARRAEAARKNLLPRAAITASGGNTVGRFGDFLDPGFLATTIAANLAQNLYTGGQLTNEARAALERNNAQIGSYTQLCLEAFRDVESALAFDRSLATQERYLRQEVQQAALAERQSTRDYADGIEGADILNVLEAQRRANNARAALIRLRNERLLNRIDLHLALGGDFRTAEI